MVDENDVLNIVKKHGPVLPADVKQEVEGNTITIGALLSQLTDDEKIQMSHTKIGGSPVYYMESQREDLQELREHLNDKEQKAFDKLKEEQVLIDDEQEPVIRASLREMKDFAIPLEAETDDGTVLFWKWYLTDADDVEELITEALEDVEADTAETTEETSSDETQSEDDTEQDSEEQAALEVDETETEAVLEDVDDDFINDVRDFLEDRDITIISEDIIRKGTEVDYVVDVPSAIGDQRYYCKAKSKKKCNDGDLSSAYIQGESKGLPVLFLRKGELTGKAEEMLEQEFKSMTVLQL